jgi:hypothetical protein
MKKTVLFLTVLLLLALSLSSCYVNIPTDYEFEYGTEGITSIEIYYLPTGVIDIDTEIHTPVAVLDESQHADILKDIEEMRFTRFQMLVPIPTDPPYDLRGYVVRINYELGDYEDISGYGVQKFCRFHNGEWKKGSKFLDCDETEWKNMIYKYASELMPGVPLGTDTPET